MKREHPANYLMLVLVLFFCTLLMAGLVGCGGGDDEPKSNHSIITREEAK